MSNAKHTKIGTITLLEQTDFTNSSYECAAWWQKVSCAPQTVDLYLTEFGSRYITFGFQGTVTDAYFPALFGGVAYGKYDKARDINKGGSYSFQLYEYNAIGLLLNPAYRIILEPGVKVSAQAKVLSADCREQAFTGVFAKVEFGNGEVGEYVEQFCENRKMKQYGWDRNPFVDRRQVA